MAILIEVTEKGSGQAALINADHILSVTTLGEPPYTIITFINGNTRLCREPPAEIVARIEQRRNGG
jgi:uncharacterized protein YlzI (FlbEa/FlbD family)